MNETRTPEQEAAEDVFFGQEVINWARWFIIAAAVVFVLMTADTAGELIVGIVVVVGLMAINFYMHARFFVERPANRALVMLTSLVDIALITSVILLWPGAKGLASPLFIMYYPAVLAFAFVMPFRATVGYTFVALVAYAVACFLVDTPGGANLLSSNGDIQSLAVEGLVTRLITLGAVGALGTYYWRIQRGRRRSAAGETADVQEQPAVS